MKEFPTLYGTGSTGKTKIFKIKVNEDFLANSDACQIVMEFGQEGGKLAQNCRVITKGKNIGKSNETTPYEQACSDAKSKWQKKKDEGYTETKRAQKTQKLLLPMLAHTYSKIVKGKETGRKKNISFPCYVQPKLDGLRCLTDYDDDKASYRSRENNPFTTLDHLTEDVKEFLRVTEGQIILDGEIYCHNEISFQNILKAVKKTNVNTPKLKYYIYDIAIEYKTFKERKEIIEKAFKEGKFTSLVMVPSYIVKDEAEIIKYHEQFVAAGYEGVIIRNTNGLYKFNHRSIDLQKWKFFDDAEFEIVGGKEATGEDHGTVVFICDTGTGNGTFDCRPRGPRELRRKWFSEIESLKGKRLTVRYQGLTDEEKPRFPVGIAIRDYE